MLLSSDGVSMDGAKVEEVAAWPQPRSVRGLRGSLGLAGYYTIANSYKTLVQLHTLYPNF
jgi:hypothetical protein